MVCYVIMLTLIVTRFGRGNFRARHGIASGDMDNGEFLRFIIFDNPHASLQEISFEDRIKPLLFKQLPRFCVSTILYYFNNIHD